MNQLAPTTKRAPPTKTRYDGRNAANLLQASDRLEEPWHEVERLNHRYPGWTREVRGWCPTLEEFRDAGDRRVRARARAEELRSALPTLDVLDTVISLLRDLRSAVPDRRATSLLVAVMVDGYPNARPHNPEAHMESLVHEAMTGGYSPGVVARACRLIARTKTFAPSVAEFLEACREASGILSWARHLEDAQHLRAEIDRMVEHG